MVSGFSTWHGGSSQNGRTGWRQLAQVHRRAQGYGFHGTNRQGVQPIDPADLNGNGTLGQSVARKYNIPTTCKEFLQSVKKSLFLGR